jgi:hypothetical protein
MDRNFVLFTAIYIAALHWSRPLVRLALRGARRAGLAGGAAVTGAFGGSGTGGVTAAQRGGVAAAGVGALAVLVLTCWLDTNTIGPRQGSH